MRLTRLPAALISALLLAGAASCATAIQGSGTIDPGVVNGGSTPGGSADPGGSSAPGESAASTPTPSPTVSAVQIRERALCVLERAAITGINTSFNKSKQRSQQVQILKQGANSLGFVIQDHWTITSTWKVVLGGRADGARTMYLDHVNQPPDPGTAPPIPVGPPPGSGSVPPPGGSGAGL